MSTQSTFDKPEIHRFIPRQSSDSRSPCPALNVLANHGYIPHSGKDLTFFQLIKAMVLVYNMSYPLALLLASVGFLTDGKLAFYPYHDLSSKRSCQNSEVGGSRFTNILLRLTDYATSLAAWIFPRPSWTLDLESLSRRRLLDIAHDGAFVHPDGKPSTCPDPCRVENIIQRAMEARDSKGQLKGGLDFKDIVRIRTENVLSLDPTLSWYHDQIALGECSLLWALLGDRPDPNVDDVIPTKSLQQWLGEERLPDGWWDRPRQTVGLIRARKLADEVAKMSKQIAEEAGIRKPTIHDAISMD